MPKSWRTFLFVIIILLIEGWVVNSGGEKVDWDDQLAGLSDYDDLVEDLFRVEGDGGNSSIDINLFSTPVPNVGDGKGNNNETKHHHNTTGHNEDDDTTIKKRWDHLYPYFVVAGMLILALGVRIFTVKVHFDKIIPESCALLVFGVLIGALFIVFKPKEESVSWATMTYDRFFLVLLPPIILEAAYELENRDFFDKFIEINILAIFGTILNIALTFAGLQVCGKFLRLFSIFNDYEWLHLILFSTIVSAVDPVAVLSIFQDLHINSPLYFVVFGESLLNDAVVVTVYTVVEGMVQSGSHAGWMDLLKFLGMLVYSYLGGIGIGIICGFLTAFVTRYVTRIFRESEPVIVLTIAYLSYLVADLLKISGIMSLTTCGLLQTGYCRHNLAEESNTTIHNIVKIIAIIDEIVIFFLLGVALINNTFSFDAGFILWSVIFCTLGRFVSVFLLIWISNRWINRNKPVDVWEMILVSFAGLRGAIAFSLVNTLDAEDMSKAYLDHSPGSTPPPVATTLQTTTLFIIAYTVFAFGVSSKYLALMLKIRTQEEEPRKTYISICRKVINRASPYIESFGRGRTSYFRDFLDRIDDWMKNWLVIGGQDKVIERDDPFHVRTQSVLEEKMVKLSDLGYWGLLFGEFDRQDYDKERVSKLIKQVQEFPEEEMMAELEIIGISRERDHASPLLPVAFRDARKSRAGEGQGRSSLVSSLVTSSVMRPRSFSLFVPGKSKLRKDEFGHTIPQGRGAKAPSKAIDEVRRRMDIDRDHS